MCIPLATIVTLKNNSNRGFINNQKFKLLMKKMGIVNNETTNKVD